MNDKTYQLRMTAELWAALRAKGGAWARATLQQALQENPTGQEAKPTAPRGQDMGALRAIAAGKAQTPKVVAQTNVLQEVETVLQKQPEVVAQRPRGWTAEQWANRSIPQ